MATRYAVIAGGGPAGLTAALELLRRTDIIPIVAECDSQVGGISKTVNHAGNRMDLGGHRFFSKSDWVMRWWQDILPIAASQLDQARSFHLSYQGSTREFQPSLSSSDPDKVMLVRRRLSRIYYLRRFFDYPVRFNGRTVRNLGLARIGRIGASYVRARLAPVEPEASLEDFFINRFGDRLYRTFFKDYTEKVWGVACNEISAEWGAQRIKGVSIAETIWHALRRQNTDGDVSQKHVETSLIERFLYPKFGPGQMWEEVARKVTALGGQVRLRHRVTGIHRDGQKITAVTVLDLAAGTERRIPCEFFFSTMPINDLVGMLQPNDSSLLSIARSLPYRDFITVGVLLSRMVRARVDDSAGPNGMPPDNWIYIQEPDVRLGRLQVFNNWCPALVADPANIWLGLEYFCNRGDNLWSMPDAKFVDFAVAELERIGLARRQDVLDGTVVRVPNAYPAYFGEYSNIGRVRSWLDSLTNVFPIGRSGMHRYNNQDHSMLAAKAAVDIVGTQSSDKSAIWQINSEDEYHESPTRS